MVTTNIYILKLKDHCWYIGKSLSVEKRVQQHMNGGASVWTKAHAPISLQDTFYNVSPFDEDKYTKEYMAKYGIDKVRGGSYVMMKLTDSQKTLLKREIWGAQDRCFKCGNSHFVYKCDAAVDVDGNPIDVNKNVCSWIYTYILKCFEPCQKFQNMTEV
jgi:predicted GIY-YIG superfamily endonuclease